MNPTTFLEVSERNYTDIRAHLIRSPATAEEAAFAFAEFRREGERDVFHVIEWLPVPPEGFEIQSAYHIELADAMRASVIKRAHDLGACLVEFHCHTGRWPAAISPSDRVGFTEFVPHVLWRLKGRPYVAVVMTASGHDGLVWAKDVQSPKRL